MKTGVVLMHGGATGATFTANGSGTYSIEYYCRNLKTDTFTNGRGSLTAQESWITSVVMP